MFFGLRHHDQEARNLSVSLILFFDLTNIIWPFRKQMFSKHICIISPLSAWSSSGGLSTGFRSRWTPSWRYLCSVILVATWGQCNYRFCVFIRVNDIFSTSGNCFEFVLCSYFDCKLRRVDVDAVDLVSISGLHWAHSCRPHQDLWWKRTWGMATLWVTSKILVEKVTLNTLDQLMNEINLQIHLN